VYKSAHVQIANLSSYNFDLNQDGVTDFTISISDYGHIQCEHGGGDTIESAYEMPASGNGVVGSPPTWLNKGEEIGPSQTFYGGQGLLVKEPTCPCQQCTGNNGYLGLSFQINGETYYGWMALKVKFLYGGGYNVVETGYAYETVANTPINAGQTK
jgi:hypothetical protein